MQSKRNLFSKVISRSMATEYILTQPKQVVKEVTMAYNGCPVIIPKGVANMEAFVSIVQLYSDIMVTALKATASVPYSV